jgi:hypothetical protein
MARNKTRKQKKITETKVTRYHEVKTLVPKEKTQTSIFNKSQVNLLYKDLIRTLLVTLVVFVVLLSIFAYMR